MVSDRVRELDAQIEEMEKAMMGEPKAEEPVTEEVEGSGLASHAPEPEEATAPETPVTGDSTAPEKKDQQEAAAATPTSTQSEVDWEKRFKNYKASMDPKIADLRKNLMESKREYFNLQQELSSLRQQIASRELKEKESKAFEPLFSKEVTQIVGDDVPKRIQEAVDQMVEAKLGPLQAELERLREENKQLSDQTVKVSVKTQTETFKSEVRSLCARSGANMDVLNTDEGFLSWLDEVDPLTGQTRWSSFEPAANRFDSATVAKYFVEYHQMVEKKNRELDKDLDAVSTRTAPITEEAPSFSGKKSRIDLLREKWTEEAILEFYRSGYKKMKLPDQEKAIKEIDEVLAAQT